MVKFKLDRILNARFTFIIIFLMAFSSQAQIVSGDVGNAEDKKEKDKKEKKEKRNTDRDSLTGTTYYLTGLYNLGHRTFNDRSVFGTYDTWNDQTPGHSGGITLGLLIELNNFLTLDMGFSYYGHRENYNFEDEFSDSTYFFSNTYMQIGVPIKLRYTYGSKFQVFGFAGLTPSNLLNVRFNESYTTKSGLSNISETAVLKEKLSIFNVMATAGFGLTYNLDWVGFTLYPEFRYNLINTYDPKARPVDHHMYGLGINAGLTLRF